MLAALPQAGFLVGSFHFPRPFCVYMCVSGLPSLFCGWSGHVTFTCTGQKNKHISFYAMHNDGCGKQPQTCSSTLL
jgi:hypothetical protein